MGLEQSPTATACADSYAVCQSDDCESRRFASAHVVLTNATACTASGGWSGQRAISGSSTELLSATTTFTLSCSGPEGSAQASVTVSVRPMPTIAIALSPAIVRAGVTSQLTWTATAATSCQASDGWNGEQPVSGTRTVGPVTQGATFTLTCAGDGGTATASAFLQFRFGENVPPEADAGPDQAVFSTETVQLRGSNSGDVFTRAWSQASGPTVTLSDPTSNVPTFSVRPW